MPTPHSLLASVLSAAALLGPATVAQAAEPDLLSRWALDTTAVPNPNAVDSRLNGTTLTGTSIDGRFGNGLSLSTSAGPQGLLAADSAGLVEPKSVTVMAWIKRASAPESWAPIVAKGGIGRNDPGQDCELNAFALMVGGEQGPHFSITSPDGSAGSQTSLMTDYLPAAQVWDDKWHAVAGIFDAKSGTLSVALDGKIVSTKQVDGASIAYGSFPQRGLSIGRYPHSSCDDSFIGYDGGVDEVRVYGRALTAAELARLQDPDAKAPPMLASETAPTTPPVSTTPEVPAQPETPGTKVEPTFSPAVPKPQNPLSVPPTGSVSLGNPTKKQTKPQAPPAPLQQALKKAEKALTDHIKAPNSASKVLKETPKLSKKELRKLKISASLDDVLDQLEFGLPLQVKVPVTARYAIVGAAITVRRKTPAGKVEIHTIALPPAVFAAKGGIAVGRVMIDPVAAKVLRKSGAIDAAVGIVSVLVSDLPNAGSDQKKSVDDKVAKQDELLKQLGQKLKKLDEAEKTADKFDELAKKAKGTSNEATAERRASEAEQKREGAEEATEQATVDLAKQMQQAMDEMVRQIIEFLRQMQEQRIQVTEKLTKI